MPGNTIGQIFRITTFGESHGSVIGVVIDGCPAGLEIEETFIQRELNRRRPGQSDITTSRNEPDRSQIISGVFEGRSTGSPITIIIKNKDHQSADYAELKNVFRPSHADYTYQKKYGHRDHRGGGRASARETAGRVMGGAVAKMLLKESGIAIKAFVNQIGSIILEKSDDKLDLNIIESNIVRCPDMNIANQMIREIEKVKKAGDSVGGKIRCVINNCPVGLGEPVFDKLQADLAKAMMSINAVKGFEYGEGFNSASLKGSENNDAFQAGGTTGELHTKTNHSGGIQGGISNGMNICFNVAFKPVATILNKQKPVNIKGDEVNTENKGRHDPCVVPRAVVIVEAMAAIVLADHYLRNKTAKF